MYNATAMMEETNWQKGFQMDWIDGLGKGGAAFLSFYGVG